MRVPFDFPNVDFFFFVCVREEKGGERISDFLSLFLSSKVLLFKPV